MFSTALTIVLVGHSEFPEPLGKGQFEGQLGTVEHVRLQLLVTALVLQLDLDGHCAVLTIRYNQRREDEQSIGILLFNIRCRVPFMWVILK